MDEVGICPSPPPFIVVSKTSNSRYRTDPSNSHSSALPSLLGRATKTVNQEASTQSASPALPMLPTPDTSHVPYERVYEPSEDSFLLLDTLSSAPERRFLRQALLGAAPLVVEVGTGSGVVVAFVHAHARDVLGSSAVLTAGVDVNAFACRATVATVRKAQQRAPGPHAAYLGACVADLASPWRDRCVDVLIFNPPYVPTPGLPSPPDGFSHDVVAPQGLGARQQTPPSFDDDSYLLALSYAGGAHGMETTDRLIDSLPRVLSPRGCAYILLCAQNRPDDVKRRILAFGPEWRALTVGSSGKTAGWEKLQVVRVWRDGVS